MTFGEKALLLRELVLGARAIRRAPYLSQDEMRRRQLERLREIVTHAYETVPFYRDLYRGAGFEPGDLGDGSRFHELPSITKDEVIEAFPDRLLSNRFELEGLIVSRSSGSSGKVLDVAYDARTLIAYVLATIRLYQMGFDYRPWHRHVYVYTSPYPIDSIFGLYPLTFVPTVAPIDEILRVLIETNPQLLVCYPSHLRQVAELATPEQLERIRPLLVSVSSEMSSQSERDVLAGLFGCPVLDNYSSEEMARIAAQCDAKSYHVFEDMNYIETVAGDGAPTEGLGKIVATNLHNFAVPLIRYEQNDLAQIEAPGCACGRSFRRLRNLQGRQNDSFTMPSGRVLTSGFLLDATYEFLLTHRTAIRDFCLVQEQPDAVLLEIVAGKGWSDAVERQISARFRRFLDDDVHFRIETVDECEKTKTGKRNPIINRLARASGAVIPH